MDRKKALVTGSSRGIGLATAYELAKRGYDVGITYHSNKQNAVELQKRVTELGADSCLIELDVRELDSIQHMYDVFLEKFGRIDLLVNNAGIIGSRAAGAFLDSTPELFQRLIETNLRSHFFGAQRAAKEMIARNTKGVIINVSSNHVDGCWPDCTAYACCKAALSKMTKNIAMELAPYGIRAVAVQPGYTDIDWGRDNTAIYDAAKRIPLGRFALPEEVAYAIAFLASDEAAYITGTALTLDGGALLPNAQDNLFDKTFYHR